MKINEVISIPLDEGPNDPHIFKAVFMAGGPGSGKSYVARKMLAGKAWLLGRERVPEELV